MRAVIGLGETILDLLFRGSSPVAAVPGGSAFNGIVSLARAGVTTRFLSETGTDKVGDLILDFMRREGIDERFVSRFSSGKSPVSLAFLDDANEASYLFYKDYPALRLAGEFPPVREDDLVLFGAYYSLNPSLRPRVLEFLEYARSCGAILYYDPNFRMTHAAEAEQLRPAIAENMEYADIVRGSVPDFEHIYGLSSPRQIYAEQVSERCPHFICTDASGGAYLQTPSVPFKHYSAHALQPVSTIGAGDSFNAGILYGILNRGLTRRDLYAADEAVWDELLAYGIRFASDVCQSHENYITPGLAEKLRQKQS